MARFRSDALTAEYKKAQQESGADDICPLCEKTNLVTFTHWRIIPNHFPYDKIAEKHDLLVPLTHKIEDDLSTEELIELKSIKRGFVAENYEFVIEPVPKFRSIPSHFHLHLVVSRKDI